MLHGNPRLASKEYQADLAHKPLLHSGCTCHASGQGGEGIVAVLFLIIAETCSS